MAKLEATNASLPGFPSWKIIIWGEPSDPKRWATATRTEDGFMFSTPVARDSQAALAAVREALVRLDARVIEFYPPDGDKVGVDVTLNAGEEAVIVRRLE